MFYVHVLIFKSIVLCFDTNISNVECVCDKLCDRINSYMRRGRHDRNRMVAGLISKYALSAANVSLMFQIQYTHNVIFISCIHTILFTSSIILKTIMFYFEFDHIMRTRSGIS